MIDQNIINASTDTANLSIINRKTTASPMLYLVNNVFDDKLINGLKDYLKQDQLPWIENETAQDHRARISWDSDTVIEELHGVCNNLTSILTDQLFEQPLNFIGVSIWKDQHPFSMGWHIDNPIINVALQVYLFDAPPQFGTSFLINDADIPVPYIHNSGYISVTKSHPGIKHRVTNPTPIGITRYSVYAIWSVTNKIIEKETTC